MIYLLENCIIWTNICFRPHFLPLWNVKIYEINHVNLFYVQNALIHIRSSLISGEAQSDVNELKSSWTLWGCMNLQAGVQICFPIPAAHSNWQRHIWICLLPFHPRVSAEGPGLLLCSLWRSLQPSKHPPCPGSRPECTETHEEETLECQRFTALSLSLNISSSWGRRRLDRGTFISFKHGDMFGTDKCENKQCKCLT